MPLNTPTSTSVEETAQAIIERLTSELGMANIPAEYCRPPEMVADLVTLGNALLPGARRDVCERLAVLHLLAATGREGFTTRDVERYKQEAIRGGYVSRDR